MSNAPRLKELALSDTGFVFDPFSGATFTVNPAGLCMLQAMRDGLALDAIATKVRERFEADHEQVERDIQDFIQLLRQHGLVPEDFST